MNKVIASESKIVGIDTDVVYSIKIKEFFEPPRTPDRKPISDGYRLIVCQAGTEEIINLGQITDTVARKILKDITMFMLDDQKVIEI